MRRSWSLPATPIAVRLGRRLVSEALAWEDTATVELLTSELLTNAVLHGREPVHLELESDCRIAHVAVTDGSRTPPQRRQPVPLQPGGRGLNIIDQLALRWGWSPAVGGKEVWFELPKPATN